MTYSAIPPLSRQHSAGSPERGGKGRRSNSAAFLLPIGRRRNGAPAGSESKSGHSADIPPEKLTVKGGPRAGTDKALTSAPIACEEGRKGRPHREVLSPAPIARESPP
jgi:hypothetical protein